MILKLASRLLTQVSPKVLTKLGLNLVFKNLFYLHKLQRQLKQNTDFFPGFMIMSLTNRCNLSCQGCWVSSETNQDLPIEIAREVINRCKQKGAAYFGLVGGEPLLYPHLFDLLAQYPNLYFQLFTNGTLLTDEVARKFRKLGNVTPLISIEGLVKESDRRRNGKNVFNTSMQAIETCRRHGLLTGVASSVCNANFSDLVNDSFIEALIKRGAHYLWYYIYRPVGPRPHPELSLTKSQILELRQFMVEARLRHPIAIIDAYWNGEGQAVCPGALGLSHHLNASGQIEFCPPLQFSFDQMNGKNNFATVMAQADSLAELRHRVTQQTDGCIILNDPQLLHSWLKDMGAKDSSGRQAAFKELKQMQCRPCHDIPGKEIPEKHWLYRFAKKYSFFGFSSYG